MKHAILLLEDEDSSVVKECSKILVTLASYDEGVIILYRFVCLFVCLFVCFTFVEFVLLGFLFIAFVQAFFLSHLVCCLPQINFVLTLSDQGVKLLKEVMRKSDTIRYRVFDIIIDSILISDQAFEFASAAGFLPKILEVRLNHYRSTVNKILWDLTKQTYKI